MNDNFQHFSEEKEDFSILKRVCHITLKRSANDRRVFHKECQSLAEAGFIVSLITASGDNETQNGIDKYAIPVPKKYPFSAWFTQRLLFRKAMQINAQIYHIHEYELLGLALKLKSYGKRVIYGCHTDIYSSKLSNYKALEWFSQFSARQCAKKELDIASKLDGIVVSSPYLKNRFLGVHSDLVEVADYPRQEDFLEEIKSNEHTEKAWKITGNLDKRRSAVELIQVLSETQHSVQVFGKIFGKNLRNKLSKMSGWSHLQEVEGQGLENRKTFLKDGVGALHLWKNTPAHQVAYPAAFFEYLAMGLPVIFRSQTYLDKLNQTYKFGISIKECDKDSIRNAMAQLNANKQEALQMGKNARKAFEDDLNWTKENKKYLILYRKVAAKEKYGYT